MWAVWPASCQAARRPVGLIESGWLVPIPSGSGGCHPVYPKRVEGAPVRAVTPKPFKIRVGSDPINRLTHR